MGWPKVQRFFYCLTALTAKATALVEDSFLLW